MYQIHQIAIVKQLVCFQLFLILDLFSIIYRTKLVLILLSILNDLPSSYPNQIATCLFLLHTVIINSYIDIAPISLTSFSKDMHSLYVMSLGDCETYTFLELLQRNIVELHCRLALVLKLSLDSSK